MLSGLRILIVEDDPTLRQVLRAILETEGACMQEAGSTREAIAMSRTHSFDVVLTDLGLPDVPGEAVITHFRAAVNHGPVVAVLSGAAERELARAAQLGADRIFAKPLDWEDLVNYLRRCRIDEKGATGPESPPTVVIVEDDAAMRELLKDVLERTGHRVIALADGTRLAAVLEREDVDAVILDKEMPGTNGLDLLSFVRHRRPAVAVILITAFGGGDVAREAARRGAYRYIEKPFRVGTIIDVVGTVPRSRIGAWRGARGRVPGPR